MANNLPSPTPEEGSEDKSSENSSCKEWSGEPTKKLTPRQIFINKISRLTKLEWGGFFADLYVALWVWSDLVSCRERPKLAFLVAAVFVAHGVLCYFLSKLFASWRWALAIWFALSFSAAGTAFNNSRHPIIAAPSPFDIVNPNARPPSADDQMVDKLDAIKRAVDWLTNKIAPNATSPNESPVWQPPELPDGCRAISFAFAGGDGTKDTKQIPTNGETISLIGTLVKDTNGINRNISIVGGHVSNNRFVADLLILGVFGYGPFRLSGNKIFGRFPPEWQMNYNNNAVEIVNNDLQPLYQVVYRRPDVVEVYGEFAAPDVLYILKRDGMEMRFGQRAKTIDPSILGINRIFKYPATANLGKRE